MNLRLLGLLLFLPILHAGPAHCLFRTGSRTTPAKQILKLSAGFREISWFLRITAPTTPFRFTDPEMKLIQRVNAVLSTGKVYQC